MAAGAGFSHRICAIRGAILRVELPDYITNAYSIVKELHILVGKVGFEPTNLLLPRQARTTKLLHFPSILVRLPGFEPGLRSSDDRMLPSYNTA